MQKSKTSLRGSVELDRVADIGTRLRALIDQLGAIFPERETLLRQALYALLTKEHVLVFGTHGTGKSDLLGCLYRSIEGARHFGIAQAMAAEITYMNDEYPYQSETPEARWARMRAWVERQIGPEDVPPWVCE